jgi:hypothetical protein
MKKLIVLFLFTAASLIAFGEVTGNAFLLNQTDHSGIKVKFIPNSPSAALDSTYTNFDGSFNIDPEYGIYVVEFSKPGFQTLLYDEGNLLLVNTNIVLSDVTLIPGNLVYISGEISGTLFPENIYIIENNVTILNNDTLTILPGTIIKLQQDCTIESFGLFIAIGNSQEKIIFTSANSNPNVADWNLILLNNPFDTCRLEHCIIEFGSGVAIYKNASIIDCEIRFMEISIISWINSNSLISNNYIHDFYTTGIHASAAQTCIKDNFIKINDSPIITQIHGIKIMSCNGKLENNMIQNESTQNSDLINGISLQTYNMQVSNNIINNCDNGIFVMSGNDVEIINNVSTNNSIAGINIYSETGNSNCSVKSNLIVGNNYGIITNLQDNPFEIYFNNVWGNTTNYYSDIIGLGQITISNNNGDPCDLYYNISLDPFFVDTPNYNFHVYEGSPVIDAGSNSNVISEFDMDGNPRILDGNGDGNAIVDMGVYEVPVELLLTSEFTSPESACSNETVTVEYLGTPIAVATYHWDFDGGIVQNGSGAGPYSINWQQAGQKTISLYTSVGNNYSDTTYHIIQIDQTVNPSVTIGVSSNPVCTNTEVTFTAFPVLGGDSPTFQWKLNGQNVGTNSPVYTNSSLQSGNMVYCILTSSEVCIAQPSAQSNNILMTVYQYPVVTIAPIPNDTTCITESITLYAGNPGCEYIWSTGESTQSIVVSNISGPSGGLQDYTVEVIKGGICSGYDTISVYFDPCTGIYNPTSGEVIKIFPNPASEMLNIELTGISQYINISILSPEGKLLQMLTASPTNYTIHSEVNLSQLPKGIYLLKIENDDFIEVRKFVKE